MTVLHPAWLAEPAVQQLLAALAASQIEARFVGGCVRDALLGVETGDIDLATPARPEAVIAALEAAKIKAVPTGLAHGTVTAVIPPRSFEITTLRRDVETDGRHAVVAFDAGWAEDAARRDFTINAMYLSPDGTLFDPVGGQADLKVRRVRFIGDAAARIAEDRLRVLRYYRFEARFGSGDGDVVARTACRDAAGKLPNLSAERVWRELARLLAGPDPVRALRMMRDDGILATILPEATNFDLFAAITRLSDDLVVRLTALTEVDRAAATHLAERLRLSSAEKRQFVELASTWSTQPVGDYKAERLSLYRLGRERYQNQLRLLAADGRITAKRLSELLELAKTWPIPVFPLTGDDVTALGVAPGPPVGRLLGAARRWWEDGDFIADRAACLAKLKEIAAQP